MAHHNLQCKRVHARIDAARAADCSAVYQEKRPKTNTHCHTRSKTRLSIGRIAGSRVSRTQRPAAGDGSAAHTADCSAKENPTLARHTADCSAKERAPELTLHAANCSAGKSEKFTYLQLRKKIQKLRCIHTGCESNSHAKWIIRSSISWLVHGEAIVGGVGEVLVINRRRGSPTRAPISEEP